MRNIQVIIHYERIEISEDNRKLLKQAVRDNGAPLRAEISIITPESRKLRGYLHGGLIPVWIYSNGGDWRDSKLNEHYFDVAKYEFSPEAVKIDGKVHLVGKSSKGSKALKRLAEALYDHLIEDYAINPKVLDPAHYRQFSDEIYGFSDYEDYISYCIAIKLLK